jgi:Zn-dependent membrane protease YugP
MALAYVFRMPGLAWVSAVGLGCLSLPCLVSLVVELDASRRARAMLLETCLVPAGESGWLSAFLGLAWSTYLALSVAILSATTLSVLVAAHVAG